MHFPSPFYCVYNQKEMRGFAFTHTYKLLHKDPMMQTSCQPHSPTIQITQHSKTETSKRSKQWMLESTEVNGSPFTLFLWTRSKCKSQSLTMTEVKSSQQIVTFFVLTSLQ